MNEYELAQKFRNGKWTDKELEEWNELPWYRKVIFAVMTRFPFLLALWRS
jgi:hypothetical protein